MDTRLSTIAENTAETRSSITSYTFNNSLAKSGFRLGSNIKEEINHECKPVSKLDCSFNNKKNTKK